MTGEEIKGVLQPMTERKQDDSSTDGLATTRAEPVTVAEVQHVSTGDEIWIRTTLTNRAVAYIASGSVTWTRSVETTAADQTPILDRSGERDSETVALLSVEPETCWLLSDGEVVDKSSQLQERPESWSPGMDEPQAPPECVVFADGTGEVQFAVPEARGGPGGEIYYCTRPVGTIIELRRI